MAQIAPASSTMRMMTPPCTLPNPLECSGVMSWCSMTFDFAGDFFVDMVYGFSQGVSRISGADLRALGGFCQTPTDECYTPNVIRDGSFLPHHPHQLADFRARAGALSVRQGVRRESVDLQPRFWPEGAALARSRNGILHLAHSAWRLCAHARSRQ